MLFNSYNFVLYFFPLVLVGYYVLNHFKCYKAALLELSFASLFFYAYDNVNYLLVLVISVLGNWLLATFINKKVELHKLRKVALIIGISLNIMSIFYFKYFNFFIDNFNSIVGTDFQIKSIVLPLGISFYTFQQVSYLVDTYKGETSDYQFFEYVAFVSFFPQLVAGPIVLHAEIIPQFRDEKRRRFDQSNFAKGCYIFSVGMFKKVIIADTFGSAVAWGWNNIAALSSLELMIVMLAYTFQIYFDFSGYCDMAVGISKLFNLDLPINFDSPYKALSINEFWKRWHMTLTRFLRNYIYFPLGGNRKGIIRTYANILIVFLVSGIWHGANWTFIFWGILHGIAQVLNRIFEKKWGQFNQVFQWICTFTFVNFSWLIFRSDNVAQAIQLIKRIISMNSFSVSSELVNCFILPEIQVLVVRIAPIYQLSSNIYGFYMWIFIFIAMIICLNFKNLHEIEFKPTLVKALGTAVLLVWSIVSFAGVSTFLYFNF